MKPRPAVFFFALLLLPFFARSEPPPAPTPADVLAVMERVADWQLAHPAKYASTDWVQAVGCAGIMALAQISPSSRFDEAMRRMGEANEWRLGRRPFHADDHAVGQTYLELYLRHGDPRMLEPTRERMDFVIANHPDITLVHNRGINPRAYDRWSWCDTLFMAPPVLARLYSATRDTKYLDYLVQQWWETSDYLYDPQEHLYFRDSFFFERREANDRKIFWARGNGWVLGGLARVIPFLPADHPARPRFERQFREMAARVVTFQQPDGLWRASLLDPESYPLKEASGSAFFCFALAWGINAGLLDRAACEPAVLRAWAALVACVTPEGKLTHVQPIGASPESFAPDATEPYGVGAFLLAGREVHRLVRDAR